MSTLTDRLAARVRWIDRWRRPVSVGVAALVVAGLIFALRGGAVVLSLAFGLGVWLVVEVGFAYVAALWETEHAALARAQGLPQAIVIPSRSATVRASDKA